MSAYAAMSIQDHYPKFFESVIHMYGPVEREGAFPYVVLDIGREPFACVVKKFVRKGEEALSLNRSLENRKLILICVEKIIECKELIDDDIYQGVLKCESIASTFSVSGFRESFNRDMNEDDILLKEKDDLFMIKKRVVIKYGSPISYGEVSVSPFEGILKYTGVTLDYWGNPLLKIENGYHVKFYDFVEDFVTWSHKFLMSDGTNFTIREVEGLEKIKCYDITKKINDLYSKALISKDGGVLSKVFYAVFSTNFEPLIKEIDELGKCLSSVCFVPEDEISKEDS